MAVINAKEIKKAVIQEIKKVTDVQVIFDEVKEGYPEKALFVYFQNFQMYPTSNTRATHVWPIQIQYQGESNINRLEMGEILTQTFNRFLLVNGLHLAIKGVEASIEGRTLWFDFEVEASLSNRAIIHKDREIMKRLKTTYEGV